MIDDRLIVSPEVMACLEADFPDVSQLFQVDSARAEFDRFPMRWVIGMDLPQEAVLEMFHPDEVAKRRLLAIESPNLEVNL